MAEMVRKFLNSSKKLGLNHVSVQEHKDIIACKVLYNMFNIANSVDNNTLSDSQNEFKANQIMKNIIYYVNIMSKSCAKSAKRVMHMAWLCTPKKCETDLIENSKIALSQKNFDNNQFCANGLVHLQSLEDNFNHHLSCVHYGLGYIYDNPIKPVSLNEVYDFLKTLSLNQDFIADIPNIAWEKYIYKISEAI